MAYAHRHGYSNHVHDCRRIVFHRSIVLSGWTDHRIECRRFIAPLSTFRCGTRLSLRIFTGALSLHSHDVFFPSVCIRHCALCVLLYLRKRNYDGQEKIKQEASDFLFYPACSFVWKIYTLASNNRTQITIVTTAEPYNAFGISPVCKNEKAWADN